MQAKHAALGMIERRSPAPTRKREGAVGVWRRETLGVAFAARVVLKSCKLARISLSRIRFGFTHRKALVSTIQECHHEVRECSADASAIYARVSSEKQAQEDTIASQIQALRHIAEEGLRWTKNCVSLTMVTAEVHWCVRRWTTSRPGRRGCDRSALRPLAKMVSRDATLTRRCSWTSCNTAASSWCS